MLIFCGSLTKSTVLQVTDILAVPTTCPGTDGIFKELNLGERLRHSSRALNFRNQIEGPRHRLHHKYQKGELTEAQLVREV